MSANKLRLNRKRHAKVRRSVAEKVKVLSCAFSILQVLALFSSAHVYAQKPKIGSDAERQRIEKEWEQSKKEMMEDCINDQKIETPPAPLQKVDICESVLGFRRDGSDIPCHFTASGGCEVQ